MAKFLQLAVSNANGLTQHKEELKFPLYLWHRRHDYIGNPLHSKKLHTNTPLHSLPHQPSGGTARGGTAILIKSSIRHQLCNYSQDFLQVTSVTIEEGLLAILAVYFPPKHIVKQDPVNIVIHNGN
jgi:hypothetical protein